MHRSICQNTKFTSNDKERPYKCCTKCEALERHRALWNRIAQSMLSPGSKVLEVAPLSTYIFGGVLKEIYPGIEYTSTDKYKNGNPNDPRAVTFCDKYCDLTELCVHFENNYYDVVLMQHVLEEIEDYHEALHNINKVLKPGGRAILEIPCTSKTDNHEHHKANKFGNVWSFNQTQLQVELSKIFKNVSTWNYVESNFKGSMFICKK